MSATKHPLELLLQNHLGTDVAALNHLPEVLVVLQQPDIFGDGARAGVLGKWNARISSLLHSREASSRWVGLYLARYTALASRQILVDNAQGWVGVVLPMLSKAEPFPNYHAAIRLLSYIFTAVTDMPEFQRQVVIPNVQKCSLALLALAKSPESDLDLKILTIDTLSLLTTHHPSHHRALQQNMCDFTVEQFQGSFPLASSTSLLVDDQTPSLLSSLIQLHAALPLTGGKVGAGAAWRKSLDSTISTIWNLVVVLRRTYSDVTHPAAVNAPFSLPALPDDPAISTPLALDRLRCMVRLLVQLLGTRTPRPVPIPLGSLMQLTLTLLRCNNNQQLQSTHTALEAIQRVTEVTAVPELCTAGCMLAQQLAQTCGKLLTPYVSQVFAAITFQLEQNITSQQRLHLLATISPILVNTHQPAPSPSYNRLAAQVLKVLSPLLPSSRSQSQATQTLSNAAERKGKKRARYEGDELFSSTSGSTTSAPNELYITALSGLAALFPSLPRATQATIQRTLLALLLHLPRSNEQWLALEVGRVYAGTLAESSSGTVGVGVQALMGVKDVYDPSSVAGTEPHQALQRFLHPRVPPNSESGPTIDDIPLFWKDEDEDEETKEFRQTAGIMTANEAASSSVLNGVPKPPNGVNLEAEIPSTDVASQNRRPNGSVAPNLVSATTLPSQPAVQPPPPVPQSLFGQPDPNAATATPSFGTVPPATTTTNPSLPPPLPSSTSPPRSPKVMAASSLFRSSGPSSTAQAAPVPPTSSVGGPSSLRTSARNDDDDDEPMPEIDLASDTDEDDT